MASSDSVEKTLALIRVDPAIHASFFAETDSPDWIEPLSAAGFFEHPPVADANGFSPWPESEYLARMAPLAPRRVARVVQRVPLTENLAVHVDLARAAAHLSADVAGKWAAREAAWLSEPSLDESSVLVPHALAQALGELADRLAAAGEIRAAISLARSLLELRAVVGSTGAGHVRESARAYRGSSLKRGGVAAFAHDPDSRAAVDDFASVAKVLAVRCETRLQEQHYQQFVALHLPVLLQHGGVDVLAMLCDLVERSIKSVDPNAGEHLLSRAAIESDGHSSDEDVSHVLIHAVRDASLSLVDLGVPVRRVVAAMDRPGPTIFRRIMLHLAAERQEADPDLAAELVLCRDNLDDDRLREEYGRLLGVVFPTLEDAQRSLVLGWIVEGPLDVASVFSDLGERRMQTRYWQASRLARIREHLNDEWSRRFAAIVRETLEPEHGNLSAHSTEWVRPSRPVAASDLRGMSPSEVAEYLEWWQPSGNPRLGTKKEVASVLEEVVWDSPTGFLNEADAFLKLPVPYVEALVRGLRRALDDDHDLDWDLVVRLLWKIVAPRRRDPDWRAARSESLLVVWKGLQKSAIGIGLRECVWTIIDSACDDPDPLPADDAKATMDAATRSLNCVRGQALHTVVQYARWLHWHETPGGRFGMDAIPKVRQRLDRHLDPKFEPSAAVRAVYGQWFPHLCLLDGEWAESNVDTIFSDRFPHLRDAAWHTYINYCAVYTTPFELLRDQYVAAVHRLAGQEGHTTSREKSDVRLGQHLLLAAGNGSLSSLDDDGLLRAYFLNAEPDDSRQAMLLVGRILHNADDEFRPETTSRFGQVAGALLGMLEADGERLASLNSLGSWLASGRFEPAWSLSRLRRLVELAGAPRPASLVMKYLAELAEKHPAQCFGVLVSWADASDPGRDFAAGRHAQVRQILHAALAEESVREDVLDFIVRLFSAGHVQYRSILEPRRPRNR